MLLCAVTGSLLSVHMYLMCWTLLLLLYLPSMASYTSSVKLLSHLRLHAQTALVA
jgi:hypothetical protein